MDVDIGAALHQVDAAEAVRAGAGEVDLVGAGDVVEDGVVAIAVFEDEGVDVGAAGEPVGADPTVEPVVAGVAEQPVVAGIAEQPVVAAKSMDGVIAGLPRIVSSSLVAKPVGACGPVGPCVPLMASALPDPLTVWPTALATLIVNAARRRAPACRRTRGR